MYDMRGYKFGALFSALLLMFVLGVSGCSNGGDVSGQAVSNGASNGTFAVASDVVSTVSGTESIQAVNGDDVDRDIVEEGRIVSRDDNSGVNSDVSVGSTSDEVRGTKFYKFISDISAKAYGGTEFVLRYQLYDTMNSEVVVLNSGEKRGYYSKFFEDGIGSSEMSVFQQGGKVYVVDWEEGRYTEFSAESMDFDTDYNAYINMFSDGSDSGTVSIPFLKYEGVKRGYEVFSFIMEGGTDNDDFFGGIENSGDDEVTRIGVEGSEADRSDWMYVKVDGNRLEMKRGAVDSAVYMTAELENGVSDGVLKLFSLDGCEKLDEDDFFNSIDDAIFDGAE